MTKKQKEVARLRREKVEENIAVAMVKEVGAPDYNSYESIINKAADMAYRASRALDGDPSWWEVPGLPYFNSRMAKLRERLKRKRRRNKK